MLRGRRPSPKAIAEGLPVNYNSALTSLNLSLNSIGVEGAKAIGGSLRVNRCADKLEPQFNNLGEDAKRALNEANAKRATPLRLQL